MQDEDKVGDPLLEELSALRKKVAEADLKDRAFHYHFISEYADDVIWLWDMAANKYLYVSPSVKNLCKFSAEEIMGQALEEVILPESARLLQEDLPRRVKALESGDETARVQSYEMAQKCKNGGLVATEVMTTFVTDKQGKVTHIQGVTRNISERKKMEAYLRESEERYRSLFQNNHAVMLVIDPESGRIMDANPAACRYYGYSLDDFKMKFITDVNMLSHDQVFEEMARAKAEQRNHFFFSHRLANGEIRPVEVYSGPITLHGQKLLYSLVHDISERKKAEEEKERLIYELRDALAKIKKLSGLLPICASCKKIRDDSGYWEQIESYIKDHSEAEFSHSICPECVKKLYPELAGKNL